MTCRRIERHATALTLCLALGTTGALAQIPEHTAAKARHPPADLSPAEATVVELYADVLPAVVLVLTETKTITDNGPQLAHTLGSGVLIGPDSLILTAAHVVDGAITITVRTQDGVLRTAKHLFSEAKADIALIQLTEPNLDLPHARLGDSDHLAVGQMTFAIGNPYGLENSFSAGRISGFRELGQLYDGTILVEFIQTDAAINSGNSGGPLFDLRGRVIGIASRIYTVSGGSQGLGFCVAINTAKQLMALEGRVWMGFDAVFLEREFLQNLFQIDQDGGLLIQGVTADSPADKAGLRGGTVIAEIDGARLLLGGDLILDIGDQQACHQACLIDAHDRMGNQDHIQIRYLRQGTEKTVVLDLSESQRNFMIPARENDP